MSFAKMAYSHWNQFMWRISDETQKLVNQLSELSQKSSWFGLGNKEDDIRRVLDKLALSEDIAAVAFIAQLLFSSSQPVREHARKAIQTLIEKLLPSELSQLGDVFWLTIPWRENDPWNSIAPKAVEALASEKGQPLNAAVLGLASFHRNGFVRQEAVRLLTTIVDGTELPFLLIRQNDWVQQISSEAQSAVEQRATENCLPHFVKSLRLPGSPDIANTIFQKINSATVFVADVSIVNPSFDGRKSPNPNVLVELGYAAGRLSWDQIICVFNKASGSIEDLPFDIRPRRVRSFYLQEGEDKSEERKLLVGLLKADIIGILHRPDEKQAAAATAFVSSLASELIPIVILGDELEHRTINPWLDNLRNTFAVTADAVRDLANRDLAIQDGVSVELEDLADILDKAAHIRLHSGSWTEFEDAAKQAVEKAKAIKLNRIDKLPLSPDSLSQVRQMLTQTQRRLAGLADRAEEMAWSSRLDDLQSEAAQIGYQILQIGHHNLDEIRTELSQRLKDAGRNLHLVETMPVYMDGGRSVQAILSEIRNGSQKMDEIVSAL
jgi:hypothetical protein